MKVAALFLFMSAPAWATDYWVSPAGLDTNSGTQASPFRQIRRALLAAGTGDTIRVLDGSYLGFDMDSFNGVTIKAEGVGAFVTVTTDRADDRDTIHVSNSTNCVIDGLRALNATRAGCRIDFCDFVTVKNCVFGDCGTWGLFTNQSNDLLIEANECYGSVIEHGIYFSNSGDRPTIRRNILHNNNANGLHMNGDMFTPPGDGIITGALVEENVIYDNGVAGGSGINCDGVVSSTIRNNLLTNNHSSGINLYQIDGGSPSHNNMVCNNTIDQASNGRWCINVHDGSTGTRIFNNIMVTHHASRGSLHFTVPADLTGLFSDYNIFTTNANAVTTNDDSSYLTLAAWQGMGYDTHSVAATQAALFVSASDFHLKAGSPAIDTGIGVLGGATGPTVDYEDGGRPFNVLFDMGCDEFGVAGGGPPVPPPAASPGSSHKSKCGLTGMEVVLVFVVLSFRRSCR